MRAVALPLAIAAAILLAGESSAQSAKLIYRVDGATATVDRHHLVVWARGAVKSGGWHEPRLRIEETSVPEARILRVDFVARPPGPRQVVVQALLPISVRKVAHLPRYGTKWVEVVSETNSVTVPITR